MTFKEVLNKFRLTSFNEKEKGTKFERLMKRWLLTDARFSDFTKVWLWEEFPGRKDFGGSDIGIDFVAKTDGGEYCAIQCKCYQESATIDKPAVDSFIATIKQTTAKAARKEGRKFCGICRKTHAAHQPGYYDN